MRDTKNVNAVRLVQGSLKPAEATADRMLGDLGRLISAVCDARAAAGLPLATGREGLLRLTQATAQMGNVRDEIIAAHQLFEVDARDMLPVWALGDFGCPPLKTAELVSIAA